MLHHLAHAPQPREVALRNRPEPHDDVADLETRLFRRRSPRNDVDRGETRDVTRRRRDVIHLHPLFGRGGFRGLVENFQRRLDLAHDGLVVVLEVGELVAGDGHLVDVDVVSRVTLLVDQGFVGAHLLVAVEDFVPRFYFGFDVVFLFDQLLHCVHVRLFIAENKKKLTKLCFWFCVYIF